MSTAMLAAYSVARVNPRAISRTPSSSSSSSSSRRVTTAAKADDASSSSSSSSASSNSGPQGQGFTQGYVPGGGGLSAEQILEIPIDRKAFKPTSEQCPFCVDAPVKENGSKCLGICRNPQNVPGPLFYPHQMQEPEDAIRLQINAMRDIDEPRRGHGVQVMWEFSVEHANMERSRYFGFSSDMYHYDHFIVREGECMI